MKAEAQRTKKEPVSEEPQVEPQSISSQQIPTDPLAAEVQQDGLLYLGFAAGIITTPPDSLQSMNIEMWPLDKIYKLHSDIISLSIIVDELGQEIQKDLQTGFEDVLNELHQNEDEEPLRFQRLSSISPTTVNSSANYISSSSSSYGYLNSPFLASSASTVIYPSPSFSSLSSNSSVLNTLLRKPKQDSISYTRPCSPSPSIMQNRLAGSTRSEQVSRSRPQSTHLRRSQSTTLSRTSMTPETLWENVDQFLKPIDKLSIIQSYLAPTEIKNDMNEILNEPVGPHYSTTICRAPNILSDPIKSKLVIPPPPSNLSGSTVSSSYLHSRLISAIVPLLPPKKIDKKNEENADENENKPKSDIENESHHITTDNEDNSSFTDNEFQFDFDQNFNSNYSNKYGAQNMSIINDLKTAEYNASSTTECTGFTGYGWLSFEERLEMELSYVGIEGSGNVVTTVDCPITQDLGEALKEREEVAKEANKWKKVISDLLQQNKSKLEIRSKKLKKWNEAMNHYHAQERAKAQQGKKKAKPSSNSTESD